MVHISVQIVGDSQDRVCLSGASSKLSLRLEVDPPETHISLASLKSKGLANLYLDRKKTQENLMKIRPVYSQFLHSAWRVICPLNSSNKINK